MNETTGEPEGLDDPALLAEIEAEFAELSAEIQRISALPHHVAPRKSELLEGLRASWRERLQAKTGDRPEWRRKLDETISRAVDRLLEDGIVENADGSLGFALRGDTLQSEGGPLLRGLLDGLSNMLSERFPASPAAAPAANPLQGLLGNLGQVLAGALKSAVTQVGAKATEAKAAADEAGDLKVVVTPGAAAEGEVAPGQAVDVGAVDVHAEQKLEAKFKVDSKSGEGLGANAFFQNLFAGLGQAVRQAIVPPTPPGEQAPVGEGTPKAGSPLGGLGQLFAEAIQRALTPPAGGAAKPTASEGAGLAAAEGAGSEGTASEGAEGAGSAAVEGAASEGAEGAGSAAAEGAAEEAPESLRVRIPQANEGAPSPEGQPAPALNVDIAGLLRQVLGNLKPPG